MAGPGTPNKGDRPDLLTAGLFIGFGALGLWQVSDLDGGTLAQMGAAYLPRVVCGLLIVIGLIIGAGALRRQAVPLDPVKWRPLVVITIAVIGFAYAVTHLGFVLASLWLIVAGSLADPGGRWREVALLAGGLTLFGALVFVYGLGVQVPLWPV